MDPERRTAKNGKSYLTATIVVMGEGFAEAAIAQLGDLHAVDSLSAVGRLACEIYKPNSGEPRLSFRLSADRVINFKRERASLSKEGTR